MNYELFKKAALANSSFDVIPTKIQILAEGVSIDKAGNMQYRGETYTTNIVKESNLPERLQKLFFEEHEVIEEKDHGQLTKLNDILFDELKSITDEKDDKNLDKNIKKANAICNVADKIINIANLSLKAEQAYSRGLVGKKSKMLSYR